MSKNQQGKKGYNGNAGQDDKNKLRDVIKDNPLVVAGSGGMQMCSTQIEEFKAETWQQRQDKFGFVD